MAARTAALALAAASSAYRPCLLLAWPVGAYVSQEK